MWDTKLSVIDKLLLILKPILNPVVCVGHALKGESIDAGGAATQLQQSRLRKAATWIKVAELGTDVSDRLEKYLGSKINRELWLILYKGEGCQRWLPSILPTISDDGSPVYSDCENKENYKNNFQYVEFEVPVRQPGDSAYQATRDTNL